MKTPVLTSKLDGLPATLDLFEAYDPAPLSAALAAGKGRHVLTVGSGGSAIAAQYLARCRDSLGLGPTTVQTPMAAVLDLQDLAESDVWIFSASADNADVVAAVRAAIDRHAAAVHLVTRNPSGPAATIPSPALQVHVTPVADEKDGFLATHSLLSASIALLMAADELCGDPRGSQTLLDRLASRLAAMRAPETRRQCFNQIEGLNANDTIILAHDPLISPLAVLMETSLWEAALCQIQATDIRNLAHGRHTWLHHRTDQTFLLGLTGLYSRTSWEGVTTELPPSLKRLTWDYGDCGRLENLFALIDGLGLVEALGEAVGLDPGRPGIGTFGRSMFDNDALAQVGASLSSAVRHKRTAIARQDSGEAAEPPLADVRRRRLEGLASARFGGAVFDYDGTLVDTADRCAPVNPAIIAELTRLHGAGVRVGIATGRGGSAGEELRKALPPNILPEVLIGYYNGGHLRPADVDIVDDAPVADPDLASVAQWLGEHAELFCETFKVGPLQITVGMEALVRPYRFPLDLRDCRAVENGAVRLAVSGHSYDLVPAASCKRTVVRALSDQIAPGLQVLCFGDSGGRFGNDYALLSGPYGISVGEVCGSPGGCWSLFGARPVGPQALLKALRALLPCPEGGVRLDLSGLCLDFQ